MISSEQRNWRDFDVGDTLSDQTGNLVDLVLIILTACSQTPAPAVASQESDVKSLRAAQDAAIEAFASKNADRMVSAYSTDASLMFPNSPILQGEDLRAAIKALAAVCAILSWASATTGRSQQFCTPPKRGWLPA